MALTKISIGGVKDDTADESKLKISNAPSDGKFLQYKDGTDKLTWADVPAGVGGANGADLNDDVKIRFGTGNDLEIYHDGGTTHHTWLKDDGVGDFIVRKNNATNLKLQGNAVYLQSGAGTETYLSAVKDGAVELNYDGAKKAETVTGGFTVTGVCTATSFVGDGSSLSNLPASGNSIDLVADGAIAAGKPCIITTAGKAKQVGSAISTLTTDQHGATANWQSDDVKYQQGIAYDPDQDHVYICYQKHESGNERPVVAALSVGATNGAVAQTASSVLSTNDNGCNHLDVIYEPTIDKGIAFWRHSGILHCHGFDFNGSSITPGDNIYYIGPHSNTSSTDQDVTKYAVKPIGSDRRFVSFWRDGSSYYVQMHQINDNSNLSLTSQEKVAVSSGQGEYHMDLAIDTASSTIIMMYGKYIRCATYSGTTITIGAAETTFSSTAREEIDIEWSPSMSKFVAIYLEADLNPIYSIVGSLTGSGGTRGVSLGSETSIFSSHTIDKIALGIDKNIAAGDEFTILHNDPNDRLYAQKLSISGTTPSLTGSEKDISSGTGSAAKYPQMVYVDHTTPRGFACIWTRNHSTNTGWGTLVRSSEVGSNITSSNFIGFAPSAINDTATGTINTYGNTVDGQSGLTAGTRYFINDNGTLGTNGSSSVVNNHGGLTAVSSSKGIIIGPSGFG